MNTCVAMDGLPISDLSCQLLYSSQQPPRTPENKMIKNITIHRGPKGFGFAMRGVKCMINFNFHELHIN